MVIYQGWYSRFCSFCLSDKQTNKQSLLTRVKVKWKSMPHLEAKSITNLGQYQASAERHEVVPERCRSRSFFCTSTTRIHFRTVPLERGTNFFRKNENDKNEERAHKSRSFSVVLCCTSTARERLSREQERPRSRSF